MTVRLTARSAPVNHGTSEAGLFFERLGAVRAHPRGWSTMHGRALLSAARERLAPMAKALNAQPDDAVTAAWELWCSSEIDKADDPWAYTAAAVRRTLNREDHAARLLTSDQGLRRHGSAAKPTVIGELPATLEREAAPAPAVATLRLPGAIAVRQWLVLQGLPTAEATSILTAVLESAARSTASSAAVDRLARDRALASQFGIPHASWRALVTIILGTTRGAPGVVELAHRGHPAPLRVEYIRRATTRFHLPEKVAA